MNTILYLVLVVGVFYLVIDGVMYYKKKKAERREKANEKNKDNK